MYLITYIYRAPALQPRVAVAPAAVPPTLIAAAVRHVYLYIIYMSICISYMYICVCVHIYLFIYVYHTLALEPSIAIAPFYARPSPIAAAVRYLSIVSRIYIFVELSV